MEYGVQINKGDGKMTYVTMMGAVWKVNKANLKKLKAELAANNGCVEDMDKYGKMIIDRMYSLSELKGY